MDRLTALLDANVLYPAGLRDFLLRLADRYLYAPLWSANIHAEWMRNLLADRPDLAAGVLERTRAVMDGHPDAFVAGLFESSPDDVLAAVRGHRAALASPPRSARDHLAALERLGLVWTASLLRPHENAI